MCYYALQGLVRMVKTVEREREKGREREKAREGKENFGRM